MGSGMRQVHLVSAHATMLLQLADTGSNRVKACDCWKWAVAANA
jgi:hypothetical protein